MVGMLGLISQVCTNVCMKTCQRWEIQKWLLNSLTEPRQVSLPVWISWAPPTSRRGEPEAWLSELCREEHHISPTTQIPETPLTSGQCPLFWNSKHTGTVFAYTYTCMYVCEIFCQMHKGQQDQVIYIFDKNIKTYLREAEKLVILLCRGCWD